jgi:hypothetical protein
LLKIAIIIKAKNEPNFYEFITIEFYLFLENFFPNSPGENRKEFHLFPKFFPLWYERPNFAAAASIEQKTSFLSPPRDA